MWQTGKLFGTISLASCGVEPVRCAQCLALHGNHMAQLERPFRLSRYALSVGRSTRGDLSGFLLWR
jgi:hypothetical protein